MLAVLHQVAAEDCSEKVNLVLEELENLQHASGGICEPEIKLVVHDEAGVGIGDGSDRIADLLYVNNYVFAALGILKRTRNPFTIDVQRATRIHSRLLEFLLNVQIRETDGRFNGGWMRAYDLEHNEYYGLNKDKDWGASCIMGGWVMGYIPLAIMHELGEMSLFA